MAGTRDIKRRIKSIGSTRKITKAMEMISATKMRKAVEAVLRTRRYANLSWSTVLRLMRMSASAEEAIHPLLQKRKEIKKVAMVLISSNRGLCGGFNSSIIKKVYESITKHPGADGRSRDTDFFLLGKKGAAIYKYAKCDSALNCNIAADFAKDDIVDEISEVIPLAQMLIGDYLSGKYDKIFVAYTDFLSAMKQIPRIRQILPIDEQAHKDFMITVGDGAMEEKKEKELNEYLFEPSPEEVLNEMIPRLVEVQLFQALLESNASEHSARMAAMKVASDAAGDLIDELTLFYNKARQAGITSEISEISAGANALSL